jgi:hypothetical protein
MIPLPGISKVAVFAWLVPKRVFGRIWRVVPELVKWALPPLTSNRAAGLLVPIPTLPADEM